MKILTTADGERIVMDDDTADFLLGPQGEAMLRRKAKREQFAAEVAAELRARALEDAWEQHLAADEEPMAMRLLHHRIEMRRDRDREGE